VSHYAAVRLSRGAAIELICKLRRALSECCDNSTVEWDTVSLNDDDHRSLRHDTLDFVMLPSGMLEVEDSGVIAVQYGDVPEFYNPEGQNMLRWCPADPEGMSPCYICGRDEHEHTEFDYGLDGCCTRTDLKEAK
jgi:hypothetical protein